jgi:hypothetical protein
LSVFARPFGECVCVHAGGGEWVVVDSCLNPVTGAPASLSYFEQIGVSPRDVRLVVVTHWDDDHVRGITDVVTACENATVAVSGALGRGDHLQFVLADVPTGAAGTVDELRSVLRICSNSSRLVFAQANLPLHPQVPGTPGVVTALSPSTDSIARGITELSEAAAQRKSDLKRRYRAPDKPNEASVVTFIADGDVAVLLGADLERTANPNAGWDAVLANARPARPADVVKVAHHGSEDAHHEDVWDQMTSSNALAIVTPLANGPNRLPGPADVERLLAVTSDVVLTAVPSFGKSELDRESEKILRRYHDHRLTELNGWGQVRARRPIHGDAQWELEMDGDARRISSPDQAVA